MTDDNPQGLSIGDPMLDPWYRRAMRGFLDGYLADRGMASAKWPEDEPVIESRPGTMGGRPVFRGTRVPVEVLFENLADGLSLGEILDSYPTLDKADCQAAILQVCLILRENT